MFHLQFLQIPHYHLHSHGFLIGPLHLSILKLHYLPQSHVLAISLLLLHYHSQGLQTLYNQSPLLVLVLFLYILPYLLNLSLQFPSFQPFCDIFHLLHNHPSQHDVLLSHLIRVHISGKSLSESITRSSPLSSSAPTFHQLLIFLLQESDESPLLRLERFILVL